MPNLQMHQLRVAAVGKMICENFSSGGEGQPDNTREVILACLFHDMGNIIKFDLKEFPEFRRDMGLQYWEAVKNDFVRKYGENAHEANVAIANEIGLSRKAVSYIDAISFSNLDNLVASESFEPKICEYADMRVGPYGVLTLAGRLSEARSRYVGRSKDYYTAEGFQKLKAAAEELEGQIFAFAKIKPEDITEEAISAHVGKLRDFQF